MKISDEIRNDFLLNDDVGNDDVVEVAYRQLLCIADCIDREMAEYERLKKENDELTAELDDWKGNAEGFEPDAYMKLPLDADGVPIRIGDTVWYVGVEKSEPQKVEGLVSVFAADGIYVMTRDYPDKATRPKMLTHKQPEPPDSWEKLEKDAMKCACDILGSANLRCRDCEWAKNGVGCQEGARLEILKRAKKLAGIKDGGSK